MTRGNKYFLSAGAAALVTWIFGLYLIGIADIQDFTASGVVDMSDPYKIGQALQDPTFTTTYSWGEVTLTGAYWGFVFPTVLAVVAFAVGILIGVLRSGRASRSC